MASHEDYQGGAIEMPLEGLGDSKRRRGKEKQKKIGLR